ncbi:MAG: hypothetical protein AB7O68_17740 [Pirellulales bacterium]
MNTQRATESTMQERAAEKPIRFGVFTTVPAARDAVSHLLSAGFTPKEVTVICSDEHKESLFREFEHQEPAGTHTPAAATAGAVIGATLGGLAAVAGTVLTGGVALLFTGGLAAWAGGVVGGLVGAMMTRGVERELADFYSQAVEAGKLLVAVDLEGPDAPRRLVLAERVLADAGAEPTPLGEG